MAAIPESRSNHERRSGGKMVRPRRTGLRSTPYDRPTSSSRDPNWFSRFISSPSRIIATGGKLLFSVFASDSSSSSSSSDSLPTSADDIDENDSENELDVSSLDAGALEKAVIEKSETKQRIAQLLMQESFSREECEWLTNIIKSRVVNIPTAGSTEAGRLDETPSRIDGNDMNGHTLLTTAVMEARKWLVEKHGLNTKSDMQRGTGALNSAMLAHGVEGDVESPVDIAKSYMRSRPPWASPSINHSEFRSPSPRQYSITGSSLNLSKYKRASSASGSWNILEEIRKVRSKATEKLLRTSASSRIDWPSVALDYKYTADFSIADKSAASREDNMLSSAKAVDASTDLVTGEGAENILDALQNDALQNTSPFSSGQNQTEEGIRSNEDTEGRSPQSGLGQKFQSTKDNKMVSLSDAGAANSNNLKNCVGSNQHLNSTVGEVHDSRTCDENCLVSEVGGTVGGTVTSNGSPSRTSMSAGLVGEGNHMPMDRQRNTISLGHDKKQSEPEEETHLVCEASTEVLSVSENDISGSQDTSAGHHEELLEYLDDANKKRKLDGKSVGVEKQPGRKMSRYNRRGRGRGR